MKYSRSPDKETTFKKKYTIKQFNELTEDDGDAVEHIVLYSDDDGREIAKIIKHNGKLIESSATTDAQDSGLYADFAKKYGIDEKDLIYTKASSAAMKAKVDEKSSKDALEKAAPKYTEEKLNAMKDSLKPVDHKAVMMKKIKQIKLANRPQDTSSVSMESKVRSRYGLDKAAGTLDYAAMNKKPKSDESKAPTLDYAAMARHVVPPQRQIDFEKKKAYTKDTMIGPKKMKKNIVSGYGMPGAGATGVSSMAATQPLQMSNMQKAFNGMLGSLRKDNKPHPAGSPEDSAHDVIEENSSFKGEMNMNKNPSGIRAFLQHMRDSKNSGWQRSAANQEAGLKKSLFPKNKSFGIDIAVESSKAPSKSENKKWAISDVRWAIDKLNEFRELRWLIEEEFPDEKEIFEEMYSTLKKEVSKEIKKYKDVDSLKKSDQLKKKQGVPKGVDPAKQERCVKQVKKQSGYNPYAVCNAKLKKCITSMRKAHKTAILSD